MSQNVDVNSVLETIQPELSAGKFAAVVEHVSLASPAQTADILERLPERQQPVFYRLLPKDRALAVFDILSPRQQSDLIKGLQNREVVEIFDSLDPDDRALLLDELPANLSTRLLRGLSGDKRRHTTDLLGYPKGSIGRRMSPHVVSTRETYTVGQTLARIKSRLEDAETIYTIPVVDDARRVVGVVGLRQLLGATPEVMIRDLMSAVHVASAYHCAEDAARLCFELRLLAMPIVDSEGRLLGILTVDDAGRIIEHAETEDTAMQGGVEPLGRPYFSTPVCSLVRSRIVWLAVLAVGAALTVHVLSIFETTLEQVTALALFVPLLIGTGGNTGNQAATTVTRALALGDVRGSDLLRVLGREFTVGLTLGALLGTLGAVITGVIFGLSIGVTIGLTLLAVCTIAASIGGVMPMIAKKLGTDPAVFSNPFISTFVDASGLIVYFLIAKAVLGI
ncbi:magnesium transporter [Trueperella abortisuis]|uniref:Magnesium transporter MgtE n=1 Tax=Trueperella abortisuis TaxID=445930 RepID=A0ABT9PH95_9ACTO|nr:magnesium transporter [Trueperella abortisuis]MDP9832084.1 magnesium transporter [Trueperella abortisuis]